MLRDPQLLLKTGAKYVQASRYFPRKSDIIFILRRLELYGVMAICPKNARSRSYPIMYLNKITLK